MLSTIFVLAIGIAIGVIFHARIKPWAVQAWQRFRTRYGTSDR